MIQPFLKIKHLLSLIVCLTLMAACTEGAMPAPKTTAQAIFQLQAAYAAALKYEVAYARLPICKPEVVRACSKVSVVQSLKRASDVTWTSIKTAQNVIRTPGYGEDVAVTAMTSATQALNAYIAITSTLQLN